MYCKKSKYELIGESTLENPSGTENGDKNKSEQNTITIDASVPVPVRNQFLNKARTRSGKKATNSIE